MRGAALLGTPPLSQTVSEVVLIWISASSFHVRIQIEIAGCIKIPRVVALFGAPSENKLQRNYQEC